MEIFKTNKEPERNIATVTIIETHIPALEVTVPDNVLNSAVNKNDDIKMTINYEGDIEQSSVSLVFLYLYEPVYVKKIEYSEFSFKIWDYFNKFQA